MSEQAADWRTMQPSYRLDSLISKMVGFYLRYSQSVDAALTLPIGDNRKWELNVYSDGSALAAIVQLKPTMGLVEFQSEADTLALAISRAFLESKERVK